MIYQTAMGIETGDTLITSYSPIPRVVERLTVPKYQHIDHRGNLFVREFPTCSASGTTDNGSWWGISGITRREDKYYTRGNPLQVIKPDNRPAMKIDMFESYLDQLTDKPYQFQNGIDYDTVDPWRCKKCGDVFNAEPYDWNPYNTACPRCGESTNAHVFVMSKTTLSEAVVGINLSTENPWGT